MKGKKKKTSVKKKKNTSVKKKKAANTNGRDLNLDLIRCAAVYLVISVHFFWNNGFYQIPVTGMGMYLMVFMRTFSMMCVPLFLLLTGYLMCKKEWSLKYYKGIIRVIGIYVIFMLFFFLYKRVILHTPLTFGMVVKGLFAEEAYSWYVKFYIGLFLLIPFLNLIYNNLKTRKEKKVLLLTLVCLTALPSVFNYRVKILPEYYINMYPITYFFIGAYIREYREEFRVKTVLPMFCAALLIGTVVNIGISYNKPFALIDLTNWQGLTDTVITPLFFILLCKINLKRVKGIFAKCITKISKLSFGMYLMSWFPDRYAYPKLTAATSADGDRWKYYIVMVGFVFICSIVLSEIAEIIYTLSAKAAGAGYTRIAKLIRKKRINNVE